jgi:hypothetical protein
MYGHAETPFQTITISALAIIYAMMLNVGAALGYMILHSARANMLGFAQLRRLLKDQELNELAILETDNTMQNGNTHIYISFVFSFVIWFVAVWKICEVIL